MNRGPVIIYRERGGGGGGGWRILGDHLTFSITEGG